MTDAAEREEVRSLTSDEKPSDPSTGSGQAMGHPVLWHWAQARAWQTNVVLVLIGVAMFWLARQLVSEYSDYTIGFSGVSGWGTDCVCGGLLAGADAAGEQVDDGDYFGGCLGLPGGGAASGAVSFQRLFTATRGTGWCSMRISRRTGMCREIRR